MPITIRHGNVLDSACDAIVLTIDGATSGMEGISNPREGGQVELRLIDYSETKFGKAVPPVRDGKFLQVVDPDEEIEYILLSPYELSKYHAQILERFCFLNEIEGRFIKMPDYYQATGADIEVIGGGHWRIDESEGVFRLGGDSTVYGRFESTGLKERIEAIPEFSPFQVIVE